MHFAFLGNLAQDPYVLHEKVLLTSHENLKIRLSLSLSLNSVKSFKMGAKKQTPDEIIYGKWQLTTSENFDEFMSRLGVSYLVRTLGNKSSPVVTVSKDDNDLLTFKQESLVSTSQISFKIGEQFDEKTADGRQVILFLRGKKGAGSS